MKLLCMDFYERKGGRELRREEGSSWFYSLGFSENDFKLVHGFFFVNTCMFVKKISYHR